MGSSIVLESSPTGIERGCYHFSVGNSLGKMVPKPFTTRWGWPKQRRIGDCQVHNKNSQSLLFDRSLDCSISTYLLKQHNPPQLPWINFFSSFEQNNFFFSITLTLSLLNKISTKSIITGYTKNTHSAVS